MTYPAPSSPRARELAALRARILEVFAAREPGARMYSVEVAEALELDLGPGDKTPGSLAARSRAVTVVKGQLDALQLAGALVSEFVPADEIEQTPGKRSGLGRRYYQLARPF